MKKKKEKITKPEKSKKTLKSESITQEDNEENKIGVLPNRDFKKSLGCG